MGLPLRTRRPPGHDPTFSTPRNQVRQVDEARSDCNRNNPVSPSHRRTRCNEAARHLRRREPGACHSARYRVHTAQKALTRFRLRPGSQPALQFFRHRADMIPLINVVVDVLVPVRTVLVAINYFYCPFPRIGTTQVPTPERAADGQGTALNPAMRAGIRCGPPVPLKHFSAPGIHRKHVRLACRRTAPYARSASRKPISPKNLFRARGDHHPGPAVCRACTTNGWNQGGDVAFAR